jgi:hypothetical protein
MVPVLNITVSRNFLINKVLVIMPMIGCLHQGKIFITGGMVAAMY